MSSFMWKATVRNMRRAYKKVSAFEWEGDYRPAARDPLKKILQDEVDRELERYLGRGQYERRSDGIGKIIGMVFEPNRPCPSP